MNFGQVLDENALFRVCFVCTGNICRSPMAEVVFKELARAAGLESSIAVISAGTGDWHVGEPADERTVAALKDHGYDGSKHRARQFDPDWFDELDLIIAFDRSHERILRAWSNNERDQDLVMGSRSSSERQRASSRPRK